jgi:DNA anti-recombination protein RmuC
MPFFVSPNAVCKRLSCSCCGSRRFAKISLSARVATTLAARLNSLQIGFQSLAIQKRSSEVWEVLAAVKTEFGKFGVVLQKVDKKLQEASNTLQDVGVRSRAIERRLRVVQELPSIEATRLLSPGDLPHSDVHDAYIHAALPSY